jgi:hypothetical protein
MKEACPSPSRAEELTLLVLVRFFELRLSVTDDGMAEGCEIPVGVRGDAPVGVATGAGNLERAECTRSSSFCIFPIRPRI